MVTNGTKRGWCPDSCKRLSYLMVAAGALMAVLVVIRVVSRWTSDSRQYEIETAEQTQRFVISRLVRAYYEMAMAGTPHPYEDLLKQHPELVNHNQSNQGAEIMHSILSLPYSSSTVDTDSDGRPEACDTWGDPLVFLTGDRKTDTIVRKGGDRVMAIAPPFFEKGFYINSLRFHAWFEPDQRALDAATAMKPPDVAASVPPSTQPEEVAGRKSAQK
jgi:hypothetical protein